VKQTFTVNAYDRKLKDRRMVTVSVDADLMGIAKSLAHKALNNKSGKSKYLGGLVEITLVKEAK